MNKPYRQGDVLIIPCNSIPEHLKKTKRCTLALGEATGHHHSILEGATGYGQDEVSLAEYIEVEKALANLTHQEHDTAVLPKGKYRVVIQSEYTPEKIVRVKD